MKIDECYDAVHKKYREAKESSANPNYEPSIVIYMNYKYWRECVAEIYGGVSSWALEFYDHSTIMGFPVWKVPPMNGRDGEKRHAPFVVVNLDK